MIGLKIKYLCISLTFMLGIENCFCQNQRNNSLGFSAGYSEALNHMQGINYNFGFDSEIGKNIVYQINAYWVSENKSTGNFNSGGGGSIDLSEVIDSHIEGKSFLNHAIITGLEAGLGYKVLNKNKVKLILSTGLSYQRLIYNEIQYLRRVSGDITNFGIYLSSYNKNHLGYYGGITGLVKLIQGIWIGPEIKWRGYFGVPPSNLSGFNSYDDNGSINLNVKIAFDL